MYGSFTNFHTMSIHPIHLKNDLWGKINGTLTSCNSSLFFHLSAFKNGNSWCVLSSNMVHWRINEAPFLKSCHGNLLFSHYTRHSGKKSVVWLRTFFLNYSFQCVLLWATGKVTLKLINDSLTYSLSRIKFLLCWFSGQLNNLTKISDLFQMDKVIGHQIWMENRAYYIHKLLKVNQK